MVNQRIDPIILEKQNKALLNEIRKLRSKPKGWIGYILIAFGIILFAFSIDYYSYITAFFSLGFIFLGGLFLYIRPTNYARVDLISSTIGEIYTFYYQLISSLKYEGSPHYLPSQSLTDLSNVYMYIPKNKEDSLHYENITSKDVVIDNNFIKLVPPGLGLSKLLEKESGTFFSGLNLDYLLNLMGKLYTENLELVKGFEFKKENSIIEVKLTGSKLDNALNKIQKQGNTVSLLDYINCSIACSIVKSTGKQVTIQKYVNDERGSVETVFKLS